MSKKLLKRSLQIVEETNKLEIGKPYNKANKKHGKLSAASKISVTDVERKLRKIKNDTINNRWQNKTEDNVKKLLGLSAVELDINVTNKILKRGRIEKFADQLEDNKSNNESVFTEEDFRKFEREYFCS